MHKREKGLIYELVVEVQSAESVATESIHFCPLSRNEWKNSSFFSFLLPFSLTSVVLSSLVTVACLFFTHSPLLTLQLHKKEKRKGGKDVQEGIEEGGYRNEQAEKCGEELEISPRFGVGGEGGSASRSRRQGRKAYTYSSKRPSRPGLCYIRHWCLCHTLDRLPTSSKPFVSLLLSSPSGITGEGERETGSQILNTPSSHLF